MTHSKLFASAIASIALFLAATDPVRAGIYTATPVTYGFSDVAGTGTAVGALTGRDDASASVTLPFTFSFYGTGYGSLFVSTNGLLTFGSGNASFSNTNLTTSPSQAAIAVLWDDLVINNAPGTARVLTQSLGAVGSREFVIQWDKATFFGGNQGDTLTFQAILFEDSNDILFNYLDLHSSNATQNYGGSATVGIKDAGTQGLDRLLLAFNNGPNEFVGNRKSTLISAVPEPATLALLGIAVAGVGFARRRKPR